MTRGVAAVILAAGEGTRMKSSLPKVLHRVGGLPMVLWSVRSAQALGLDPIVLVVGTASDSVKETVGDTALYAFQGERLGTAHATLQAREVLQGKSDAVLVLYADMPTLRFETLQRLISLHMDRRPAVTILTVESEDSMGFGRVVRDEAGRVVRIVEEAAATPRVLKINELNCGVYCFDGDWLWERLPDVDPTPPKGEYYLPDMIGFAITEGRHVEVVTITDVAEVQGINTRVHLARSGRIIRDRINEGLMLGGVTLVDPATTYVEATVQVGRDTVIYPNTILQGETIVGERCVLGPNTLVRDTQIGDDCKVLASVLEEAVLEGRADIGPFGHLRKGAHLGVGVHMGNFGEVKNAYLAPGAKMGHFSYIGDAEVGEDSNIGAGTITCNYDGERKHRTVIGEGAFIGSGAMLVAPVNIGKGATIGAGSVVTHDVPDGALVYGAPAREKRKSKREAKSDETT